MKLQSSYTSYQSHFLRFNVLHISTITSFLMTIFLFGLNSDKCKKNEIIQYDFLSNMSFNPWDPQSRALALTELCYASEPVFDTMFCTIQVPTLNEGWSKSLNTSIFYITVHIYQ